MPKKKSPYAQHPKAPAKKVADKPLVQNASLGNDMPSVPFKPTPPEAGKPPIGGVHGFGHKPHQRAGKLRLSGRTDSHHIGKRVKAPY